jgi:hypothetical protein
MSFRDPETGAQVVELKRVRYTHEAMVDFILANPGISQNQIASHFGYTPSWVSTVLNSDSFQAYFGTRKEELVDPALAATINERLRAVADQSLKVILEKLSKTQVEDEFALQSAKLATAALGYGAKAPAGTNVGVIIQMPGVAPSAGDWAAKHSKGATAVIDVPTPVAAAPRVDHEDPQIKLG